MFQEYSFRRAIGAVLIALSVLGCAVSVHNAFSRDPLLALPSSTVKVILDAGHGSGVHIGDGYVITAGHVVGDKNVVNLKLDSGSVQTAEVLWSNKDYDVALLRTKPTMRASPLDCRVASVGEAIVARGNPASSQEAAAKEAWLSKNTGLLIEEGGFWRRKYRVSTRADAEKKFESLPHGYAFTTYREMVEIVYRDRRRLAKKIADLCCAASQHTMVRGKNIGDGFVTIDMHEARFLRLG